MAATDKDEGRDALTTGPVRLWFDRTYPDGPTPAQASAWPAIAAGENLLLISPTGTGKTLAAFLAILDGLFRDAASGTLTPGLRCVYVSSLKSLGYDIARNLTEPLAAIEGERESGPGPVRIAVRTGDTSAYFRRKQRDEPPHILITTPESLTLLLSQSLWHPLFFTTTHVILDEIHSLVPTKRGADLAVSIERLTALSAREPCRVGLSATCRDPAPVARYLVGPDRTCRVVVAENPDRHTPATIEVVSLLRHGEGPHRALTYRRMLRRVNEEIGRNRTTIVFAQTRALTERITHDLRRTRQEAPESVAAHHSALDARRRHEVEAALKSGALGAVVTSTSLELGVDIGSVDLAVLVGLPGSVARCLQRVGRAGHRVGVPTRGLMLAATPAELAGAAVTAHAAKAGRIEPLRVIQAPLDVLCQQLIGMACAGEWSADAAFALVRRTSPFENLARADFDACLNFLAGELAAPSGAYDPEAGAPPRWTSPRIWKSRGYFGLRSRRVMRWFRANVGTITSEESVRVVVDGRELGTLEGAYAERLQPGDRFVLDGRALEFRRLDGLVVNARATAGDPELPRWTSDRQSLSTELARDLARFRDEAADVLRDGLATLRSWIRERFHLDPEAASVLAELFESQQAASELPASGTLLVEESPHPDGFAYAFHAPLSRSACEAVGRAVAARLGRRLGRDLSLAVADLGWSIRIDGDSRLRCEDLPELLAIAGFEDAVLEGLDRGDLMARRFRHVAATALMVLRNPEGGRTRVGGLLWVSRRLFPLVRAACPDHPLLRETRREVLEDLLDTRTALAWLHSGPSIRLRRLEAPSPFTATWIDPAGPEPLHFEPPVEALRRLHARLMGVTDG